MINFVTKRDGSIQQFDISKIKKVINWACEGLEVNPIELESNFIINLKEKISTLDIHKTLMLTANKLISEYTNNLTYLDYDKVAGKLHSIFVVKNALLSRNCLYQKLGVSFSDDIHLIHYNIFFKTMLQEGVYNKKLLTYSKKEIEYFSQHIIYQRNYDITYSSSKKWETFLYSGETIQDLLATTALMLCVEHDIPYNSPFDRINKAIEYYDLLSTYCISLASPILRHLRGNKSESVTSCFIMKVGDSIESIFSKLTDAARISKAGGGLGIYLSELRAKGFSCSGCT